MGLGYPCYAISVGDIVVFIHIEGAKAIILRFRNHQDPESELGKI